MPQMSPMNWLFFLFFFYIYFLYFISLIYFNDFVFLKKSTNLKFYKNLIWYWMW